MADRVESIATQAQEIVDRIPWDRLTGKTVVLTGATGFLGRWFQHSIGAMVRAGCRVNLIGWDNYTASTHFAEPARGVQVAEVDVTDYYSVQKAAPAQVDFIIHAAGIASPPRYIAEPLKTIDASVTGTRNVLELAKQRQARLLYFSSSEAYGDPDPDHIPTREDYRGNVSMDGGRAPYDEGKRMGETLCSVYTRYYGVETIRVRPFNVYGPEMDPQDRRALPNLIHAAATGEPFRIYGDGAQTRTFCYVSDAVIGFWLALLKGRSGEAYNIGNYGPEISVLQMVEFFEAATGAKINVEHIPNPAYDQGSPSRRRADLSKAMRELGYVPRVSFAEGLARTLTARREFDAARARTPA